MAFQGFLKQSTAVDVLVGPFLDEDDGKTAEPSLTISQADVKLSKNGQTLAQKSDATALAADANGYYNCELDATDTNTVGQLTIIVHESGALPVRLDYHIVEEAVYDAMYGGSAAGPLQSTTAGRTLDVTAGGTAGIDWANVENNTNATNLSATTVNLCNTATTLTNTVTLADGAHGGSSGVLTLQKVVVASSANDPGVSITGSGTGAGIKTKGGDTGIGLQTEGGANGGAGFSAQALGNDENGVTLVGVGAGHGLYTLAGATGDGASFNGGVTSGNGIDATGTTDGYGIYAEGDGGKDGIRAVGDLAGHGIYAEGGATGNGVYFVGGLTSGSGIKGEAQTSGDGMELIGAGTGNGLDSTGRMGITAIGTAQYGFHATSGSAFYAGAGFLGTANNADGLQCQAHGTGEDISADITGGDHTDLGSGTSLGDMLTDMAGATFATGTDSLEALRNRGDAAWITGGGGALTEMLNVRPMIPHSIDLADTATVRLSLGLTNGLDDLPTTVEITPGTITVDRKAVGGTSWTNVVNAAACSEAAGLVYYDEVFDSGTGYAAGDSIRITFKSQKITVAANDYEITGTDGWMFQTEIRGASSAPTAAAVADAVWDEAAGDHDTEDTFGNVFNDLTVEDSGGVYQFTANALELGPTVAAAASSSQGAVDSFALTAYQYAALGPFAFTATAAQTGDSHAFTVYATDDPTDGVFELTTAAGDIAVSGAGDLTVTVSQDDTNTSTAGLYQYILRNTTDDTVIARGSLKIREEPEVGS